MVQAAMLRKYFGLCLRNQAYSNLHGSICGSCLFPWIFCVRVKSKLPCSVYVEFMAAYAQEGEPTEVALARFAGEKMMQAADDPEMFRIVPEEPGLFESVWQTLSATRARMHDDAVFDGVTFFMGILLYLFISMVPLTMVACVWAARFDAYYRVLFTIFTIFFAVFCK